MLIRQLFHIKQVGPVFKYIEKFVIIVDHLAAYESQTDPLYYTLKFIDGLRDDIKFVVVIQRPSYLDTAYVLVEMQDEVTEPLGRNEFRRPDYPFAVKNSFKQAHILPAPPSAMKIISPPQAERKQADVGKSRNVEDKMVALKLIADQGVSVKNVLRSMLGVTGVLLLSSCMSSKKCGNCFNCKKMMRIKDQFSLAHQGKKKCCMSICFSLLRLQLVEKALK